MFYREEMDDAFRFGDVLRGYILTTPDIEEPILVPSKIHEGYKIEVGLPLFSVVISPCCSIGEKKISLAPLIQVRNSFFDNPYFAEDLTKINRTMNPQEATPPNVWVSLPLEEKQRRLEEGPGYAFLEFFIYERNILFPEYPVHRRQGDIKTRYYMIDFRDIYKINCQKIITPEDSPLNSKCLQLSIDARSDLRDKIVKYYSREPVEDKILED